jgi:hypothetical protein
MLRLLSCLRILILWSSWAGWVCSVPSTVNIGGIFAPISSTGVLARDQQEHLAAFVMAINEINNKSDGLYDNVLVNTTLKFSVEEGNTMATALSNFIQFQTAFAGAGVASVVNTLPNDNALYVNQLATNMKLTTVMSYASNGAFYADNVYPYSVKVAGLVSHASYGLQSALCSLGQKMAFFLSLADEDIQALYELSLAFIYAAALEDCQLSVLAEVVVRTDMTDMSSFIGQAIGAGARYFMLLLPASQAAQMIEQGYAAGLFDEYSVIFTTDRGAQNITSYFTPEADVSHLLTGFFTINYWPDYYMGRTAASIAFAKRWQKQASAAGAVVNGTQVCNSAKDDDGDFYLYKSTINNVTTCTGLDFSSYSASGSDLQPFTTLTYDATILTAMALDYAIKNGVAYTGTEMLHDIFVTALSMQGVSGPIAFNTGFSVFEYDGQATRAAGMQYRITNFNPTLYAAGDPDYMVTVGQYDADARTTTWCTADDDATGCHLPTYRLAINGDYHTAPPDAPSLIVKKMYPSWTIVFIFFAALLVAMVLAFGAFTIWYRNSKIIKASQPLLLGCILVGGLVAAARILVGTLDKTTLLCRTEFWTGHVAFVIMIGGLFVKSYRVHCIVNTKQLRRVTFSATDAFRMLIAIVLFVIVYLIFATIYGQPHLRVMVVTESNQETEWKFCGMKQPQFQTALFAAELLLLIVGFRTCWDIRNVPDIVNESRQISSAMSVIVLVSLLILPIVSFLRLPAYTSEFVAALGFGFSSVCTLVLLFVPKVMVVYGSRHERKVHSKVIAVDSNPFGGISSEHPSFRQRKSKFVHDAEDLLRNKAQAERLVICQEQLVGWQAMVLNEQSNMMWGSQKEFAVTAKPGNANNVAPNVVVRHHSSYQAVWDNGSQVSVGDNGGSYGNRKSEDSANKSKSSVGENGDNFIDRILYNDRVSAFSLNESIRNGYVAGSPHYDMDAADEPTDAPSTTNKEKRRALVMEDL